MELYLDGQKLQNIGKTSEMGPKFNLSIVFQTFFGSAQNCPKRQNMFIQFKITNQNVITLSLCQKMPDKILKDSCQYVHSKRPNCQKNNENGQF